ncbi:MAG: tetratricopeptide repeat protein [Planctomycetaceae bacterium]|nr:tetratricopeptide repeat protein [Planctomycetaceae bacterium]
MSAPAPIRKQDDALQVRRHVGFVYCGIIIALTAVVYWQVRSHQFVNFDDGTYVSENPHVRSGLTWANLVWAFSRESVQGSANWHPLTWWSLMLDAEIYGLNAGGFLVTNLLFHLASSLLLFRILFRTTRAIHPSAFVAIVFAIHPLHVESVAWVAERKDVLSVFFGLLSIELHLQFVGARRIHWHLASLIAYSLSLASKQMLVTLPCVLLLMDVWPLGRSLRWAEKSGYLILTVIFCGVAFFAQADGAAVASLESFPVSVRVLNAISCYMIYLIKTIVPMHLSVYYPYPAEGLWLQAIVGGLILALVSAGVIRTAKKAPWMLVGWLWFLGTLVPVIGLVQIGTQRMADRYMYFPMIGLLLAVAWSGAAVCRRSHLMLWPVRVIAAGFVLAMTLCAWRQTAYWKNTMTLFTHAVDVAECSMSLNKLGYEYAATGDVIRASNLFHRALELDPDYVFAYVSLGNVSFSERRLDEAEGYFRRAIELSPMNDEAQYNLGLCLAFQGQPEEAIVHYKRAIEIGGDNAQAYANMGIASLMLGRSQQATKDLTRALDLDPQLLTAHFHLAQISADAGDALTAIRHLQKVVSESTVSIGDQQLIDAHLLLAQQAISAGQDELARASVAVIESLQPDHQAIAELREAIQRLDR